MVPKVGKIKSDVSPHLNIRNEPDPTSVEVAEFDPGTEFLILGEVEGKSYRVRGVTQKNWYKIKLDGREAFAAVAFVELVTDDNRMIIPPSFNTADNIDRLGRILMFSLFVAFFKKFIPIFLCYLDKFP